MAREATESLLKLELLLVTVQASLSLEQHALLVGALGPEQLARLLGDRALVQLGHLLFSFLALCSSLTLCSSSLAFTTLLQTLTKSRRGKSYRYNNIKAHTGRVCCSDKKVGLVQLIDRRGSW